MRRRLIQSTLAVVLVVIAVFGVSLVIVETRTISTSAQERVDSEAAAAGQHRGQPADRRRRRSTPRSCGPGHAGPLRRDPDPGRRRPSRSAPAPPATSSSGTAEGEEGETVTVQEPRSTVTREVGRTLLIIGAVALLAIVAAVLLAVRQAHRLAAPLTDLAETAERLGSGDPRPRHKRYGVPELDRVADVLDASAERIARMLTAERRLAADASHQLRTPLTALSMRLEEITVTDDPDTVKEEATIALAQVERLTDVVRAAAHQLPRPAHRFRRRLRPGRGRQAAARGVAPGLPQRGPRHRQLRASGTCRPWARRARSRRCWPR